MRPVRGHLLAASIGALLCALALAPAAAPRDLIPAPIQPSTVHVGLKTIAKGLIAPIYAINAPGDQKHLYVVDQPGRIWQVDIKRHMGRKRVFLDVSDRIVPLGPFLPFLAYDERGLLGVAFDPNYRHNGLLYTYTSEPLDPAHPADFSTMPPGVAADHVNIVAEWRVPHPKRADSVVDPSSRRELLRVENPQFNHDSGTIAFGPDRLLYIGQGDGGAGDDQGVGHNPDTGNAQDPSVILGKVLRIDPHGHDSANGQYGIPASNPFVGMPGVVPEIYALGFRNPYRFSFDTRTGKLYLADAGQNDIEEVDVVTKGGNYGWHVKEGTFLFDPNGDGPGFASVDSPGVPAGLIDPIAEYDHDEGIVAVGGFVYRGHQIRPLRGSYVFGDFAHAFFGDVREFGRVFQLGPAHTITQLISRDRLGIFVEGFGQDRKGELYVLGNTTGAPFPNADGVNTGVVLKIVRPRGS